MHYEPGVPENLHIDMVRLLPMIDYITVIVCNRAAVITSTTDGKHTRGSKHYRGLAIDLRTRDLPNDVVYRYCFALSFALRKLCKIFINADHIHLEFSPDDY